MAYRQDPSTADVYRPYQVSVDFLLLSYPSVLILPYLFCFRWVSSVLSICTFVLFHRKGQAWIMLQHGFSIGRSIVYCCRHWTWSVLFSTKVPPLMCLIEFQCLPWTHNILSGFLTKTRSCFNALSFISPHVATWLLCFVHYSLGHMTAPLRLSRLSDSSCLGTVNRGTIFPSSVTS